MANTIPCINPAHGVQNHIAGTAAAIECASSRGVPTGHGGPPLGVPSSSLRIQASNADAVTEYASTVSTKFGIARFMDDPDEHGVALDELKLTSIPDDYADNFDRITYNHSKGYHTYAVAMTQPGNKAVMVVFGSQGESGDWEVDYPVPLSAFDEESQKRIMDSVEGSAAFVPQQKESSIDANTFPGQPQPTVNQVHMDAGRMSSKMYGIMTDEGMNISTKLGLSSLMMEVNMSGAVGDRPTKYVIDNATELMKSASRRLPNILDHEWGADISPASKERVITDFAALIDERLARLEAQRAQLPSAPPIFRGTPPDWAYGNSTRVPRGTYQGDDEVQITEYRIEGQDRNNFMLRRDNVTAYIEGPDISGLFDGMRAVNERHTSGK